MTHEGIKTTSGWTGGGEEVELSIDNNGKVASERVLNAWPALTELRVGFLCRCDVLTRRIVSIQPADKAAREIGRRYLTDEPTARAHVDGYVFEHPEVVEEVDNLARKGKRAGAHERVRTEAARPINQKSFDFYAQRGNDVLNVTVAISDMSGTTSEPYQRGLDVLECRGERLDEIAEERARRSPISEWRHSPEDRPDDEVSERQKPWIGRLILSNWTGR